MNKYEKLALTAGTALFIIFFAVVAGKTYAMDKAEIDANGRAVLVPGWEQPGAVVINTPPPPVTICTNTGTGSICTTY